jgi:hypothetical protein
VSEQIDAAKGRSAHGVAVNDVDAPVELNSPAPSHGGGGPAGPRLPFDWVNDLGEGLVAGRCGRR